MSTKQRDITISDLYTQGEPGDVYRNAWENLRQVVSLIAPYAGDTLTIKYVLPNTQEPKETVYEILIQNPQHQGFVWVCFQREGMTAHIHDTYDRDNEPNVPFDLNLPSDRKWLRNITAQLAEF